MEAKKRKKKDLSEDIIQQGVYWRVNTPQLIAEIANNNSQMSMLRAGLQIFMGLLAEVGECASRINDDELNGLMCRLAIYEISDPYNDAYDQKILDKILRKYEAAKIKLKNDTKSK